MCDAVIGELREVQPRAAIEVEAPGTLQGSLDADRGAQVLSNLVGNGLQQGARASRCACDSTVAKRSACASR